MQASSSSSRMSAIVSLVGAILILAGFFLPMFMQSNPQVPGSIHPVYEWQAVTVDDINPGFATLVRFLAALPVLGMLIILTTNIATLYRVLSPGFILLKRVAAGWGLGVQLLFDGLVFQVFLIGYARTDITWGFAVVLVGFIVSVIGAFFIKPHPRSA